jgi:hypothetical protein
MSTSTAVSAGEGKGVEAKKEAAAAVVTEAAEEVAVDEEEGDCDCEECQGGGGEIVEYEEEGGWIGELGVDEHDFY